MAKIFFTSKQSTLYENSPPASADGEHLHTIPFISHLEEAKKSSYNGYTDARKEANKRYMENFVGIKVRTTPKHRETIKAHASSTDESVNSFIIRAIDETMERDKQHIPISKGGYVLYEPEASEPVYPPKKSSRFPLIR